MNDEPKFCKDCKHFKDAWAIGFGALSTSGSETCNQPPSRDLIHGRKMPAVPSQMRTLGGLCGVEARLWEEIPPAVAEPTYRIDVLFGHLESDQRERVEGDTTYFECRHRNVDKDGIAEPWSEWSTLSSMRLSSLPEPAWWEFWK